MINTRLQLTLFVDKIDSCVLEEVRRQFNPIQYHLIKCHLTLCRDEEVEIIMASLPKLITDNQKELAIDFGTVQRFDHAKGVLLPGKGENEAFHRLRKRLLKGTLCESKVHTPHITLMHPRNSNCTDIIFDKIKQYLMPERLVFKTITLIRQQDDLPWQTVKEFSLNPT